MLRGLHFRVRQIPFHMQIWFPLTLALLFLPRLDAEILRIAPLWAVATFIEGVVVAGFTVIVHELGHCWAYRRYDQEPSVVLWGLGGLTYGRSTLDPRKEIVISLAGPLTEILLLGLPAFVLTRFVHNTAFPGDFAGFPYLVLHDLMFFALVWGLVNLVPLLPLDGGHICEAVLEIVHGEPRKQTARLISVASGVILGFWGLLFLGSTLVMLFGWVLAAINAVGWWGEHNNSPVRFDIKPVPPSGGDDNVVSMDSQRRKRDRRSPAELLASGYSSLEHRDYAGALRTAERLEGKRLHSSQQTEVVLLSAWAWLGQRNPLKAEEALAGLPKGTTPPLPMAATLALGNKQIDRAIELMIQAMIREPDSDQKLIAVDLFAEFGQIHRLARDLVDTPGGSGFEAAVSLESLLHRLNRIQDASTVNDVIMLG